MHQLTKYEFRLVSGASEGIFYFEGKEYPFSCPAISQPCLTAYLSFLGHLPPGKYPKPKTLIEVLNACGGFEGINDLSPCFEQVVEQVHLDLA